MIYPTKKIKDIGTVVTGKTPLTARADYYDGQYMFVTPTELHGSYKVTTSEKTITEAGLNSIKSNSISGESILVGCIGWDMGNVAMCFEKCATNQQINSITKIKKECIPAYLYYWLKTKKDYLFSIASVTRTPILSKGVFEDIDVPLPDVETQRNVANVLQKLDEKIELNEGINDNLQQMAYDTFMHSFFRKESNGKLGDIIVENAKSPIQVGDAKAANNGDIPFFTSGDAVLKWPEALVTGRNCYLNTGGNADVKFYVGDAAYSTDTWCITASGEMSDYLYLLLLSIKPELNQKYFQGTGLKHLQKPMLKDRPIYIPATKELDTFNKTVQPWFDMIASNVKESQSLVALRDWLLPMLMNGQAVVED